MSVSASNVRQSQFGAKHPFEEAVEPRLSRGVAGRLQEAPVEDARLGASLLAVEQRLAVMIGGAEIDRLCGLHLFGGEAIVSRAALAGECGGVEVAGQRVGDEWIGLEAVTLGAAGGDGRLGEKREVGVGELVAGLQVRRLDSWSPRPRAPTSG